MIQIKRSIATVLVVGSVAWAGSPSVPEQYQANLRTSVSDQLCRGARALEKAQGDFAVAKGKSAATWEWEQGSGAAADNTSGIVALALVRTSKGCGPAKAFERYAKARAAEHDAARFLFDADVETLALAGPVLGDTRYRATALAAFERRYSGATGREAVERLRMVRSPNKALLGYDAALAIRAGLAVNQDKKAKEIADAVLATPGWAAGADTEGFLTTSRGAMLEALALLDGAKGKAYASARRDLVQTLKKEQAGDGSFAGRNTQATAYAVRGLAKSGDESAQGAVAAGRRWLRLTQLTAGTWATFNDLVPEPFVGDHVPEVTAEAMLALAD